MERWHAKVICLFGIFILPFICTILPYKVHSYFVKKGKKGQQVLSCLMCFGGGVFFATFILHMGPEVRFILDQALIKPHKLTYPVADAIMGAGFFLVFFLEKVILKCYKKRHLKKMAVRQEQCYQFNKTNSRVQHSAGCDDTMVQENGLSRKDSNNIVHVMANGASIKGIPSNDAEADGCPLRGTGECCHDDTETRLQLTDSDEIKISEHAEGGDSDDNLHAHTTRSLVLIVALSLHRIFEGMSLGLQHTTQNVWNLFIAVLCHETVIGFGLGLQFVKNKFSLCKLLVTTTLCSLILPIGIAIGTAIVEVGSQGTGLNLTNGILQAVSTGTFIYVTFFEILQEEIDPHDTSMSKFCSVFVGFLVMAALSAVPEEQPIMAMLHANQNITMTTTLSPLSP